MEMLSASTILVSIPFHLSPVAEIVFICHETLIDSIHCGDVRQLLIDRNIINQ